MNCKTWEHEKGSQKDNYLMRAHRTKSLGDTGLTLWKEFIWFMLWEVIKTGMIVFIVTGPDQYGTLGAGPMTILLLMWPSEWWEQTQNKILIAGLLFPECTQEELR